MKSLGTFSIVYYDNNFVYINMKQSSEDGFYEVKYVKQPNNQLKRIFIENVPLLNEFVEIESILLYVDENDILEIVYQDIKKFIQCKFPSLADVYKKDLYYKREEFYIINQKFIDYNIFVSEDPNNEVERTDYTHFTLDI